MIGLGISTWEPSILGRPGGIPSFPAKDSYQQDYAGIANSTTLRSLGGWAAYNSTSSTSTIRDQLQIQSEAVQRTSTGDFATAPGLFVIGRDTGSTDHVLRTTVTALPSSGRISTVVAATHESNCITFDCTISGGVMQNYIIRKNVGGALTTLLSQASSTSTIGRALLAGDEIEVQVLGRRVHLFVNGYRITPAAGSDIDTGGAFTKGTICGFGTISGTGARYDDTYIAALGAAVTITDTPIFWPGSVALGGRLMSQVGTYTGDVQALDYRVVNATTGAEVQTWVRMTGATIAAGSWSASVFAPMCSIATNPKLRIQVRAANDVDARALSNATAVGLGFLIYGQSNAAFMGQGGATSYAVANAYSWSQDASSVWQGGATTTTTRSQRMASEIAARSGIPAGICVFGVGSQTLANLTSRGAGYFDEFEAAAATANIAGYGQGLHWVQGEAEAAATGVFDEPAYDGTFDTLIAQVRDDLCESPDAPIGVGVIGTTTGGHISGDTFGNANWSAARACLFGLSDKPGVFAAASLTDATLADTLHYIPNSYVEFGRRAGLSMAQVLGYGGYNGRGPLITGATRAAAVITLAVDLNGAASVAGTGLTNYEATLDGFATTLTINSAEVSGGNIVLTLSADPGAPIQVRSFYGMTYGTPTLAIGTYADATTIPVEPLFAAITSD